MKKLFAIISSPFLILPILVFLCKKERFVGDLERYKKEVPFSKIGAFYLCYCLMGKKEYRSVFAYRSGLNLITIKVVMLFVPPLEQIENITANIGSGMRLFHKSGCVIRAERIGENFTCGQGVTVGFGKYSEALGTSLPIIGDNVWIAANATVIGGISIGNNSVIAGGGAVVVHDIPENSTVAGNPAQVISKAK